MGIQCAAGKCIRVPAPAGAALPQHSQVQGDCKRLVCDGEGHAVIFAAPMDLPLDDNNDCTEEACDNDIPQHHSQAPGFVCNQNGICNGEGQCGVCLPNSQRCEEANATSSCTALGQWTPAESCKPSAPACRASRCQEIKRFAVGAAHACVILQSGDVECWGSNEHHQLGTDTSARAVAAAAFDQVHYGRWHACAVRGTQGFCWGANQYGQLGRSDRLSSNQPQAVQNLSNIKQMVVGDRHSCALASGEVYCWGSGPVVPQANNKSNASKPSPPAPSHFRHASPQNKPRSAGPLRGATHIRLGAAITCATDKTGSYRCLGRHSYPLAPAPAAPEPEKEVPRAATAQPSGLQKVPHLQPVIALACGADFCCAHTNKNTVQCWGNNNKGQLGTGDQKGRLKPQQIAGLQGVLELAAGRDFACARKQNAEVQCWGNNSFGQAGKSNSNSNSGLQLTPHSLFSPKAGVQRIALGESFGCAKLADRSLHCWGDNRQGQVGRGTTKTKEASGAIRW